MPRAALAALLLPAWCGSCSTSAPPPNSLFTTHVDQDSKISDLSAGNQTLLCEDVQLFTVETLLPDVCRLYALNDVAQSYPDSAASTESDLQTACATAYARCVSNSGDESRPSAAPDAAAHESDAGFMVIGTPGNSDAGALQACETVLAASPCKATVSALSQCLDEEHMYYGALPSCNQLTTQELGSIRADGSIMLRQPPSCADLAGCMLSVM